MLKISMLAPDRDEELNLARRMLGRESPENVLNSGAVEAVITGEALAKLRPELEGITVRDELVVYIVDIVRSSRKHEGILVGAGPRATQALLLAARAVAAIGGRDFVTPDDVKTMAGAVLEHRLVLRPEYEIEGVTAREVTEKLLQEVAVPR